MTSYYSITISKRKQWSEQNDNNELDQLKNYIMLYHTYFLMFCNGHIEFTNHYSIKKCGNEKIK